MFVKVGHFNIPLRPVVSDPIFDKKVVFEQSNIQLSSYSSSVKGGETIFLLCEKVDKDIEIIFFEKATKWKGSVILKPKDLHKNYAIIFKTPPYRTLNIKEPVQVGPYLLHLNKFHSSSFYFRLKLWLENLRRWLIVNHANLNIFH